MQLIAPDILADATGLSIPLVIACLVIGIVLWLFGWRTHRFWLVLVATVFGGLYGLYEAESFRTQPLVAAVLLAVTAGVLALAVVRLLAFAAGGFAGLFAIQVFLPAWDQPLVAFVVCGLVGLFVFRISIMALTSFCGTLLLVYAGLCLANHYGQLPAVRWSEEHGDLLNWGCGLVALVGLVVQFAHYRRRGASAEKKEDEEGTDSWFPPILKLYRKAG